MASKRRRFSRVKHRFHKPKMLTKAINAAGLLIAFNREIGVAVDDFQNGTFISNPKGALADIAYAGIGLNTDGSGINAQQLTASVTSKVAGYAFVKLAKFFTKRLRF